VARREVDLKAGYYYHIYNRGHNRASIFFQQENYVFFLGRLRKYVTGQVLGDTAASSHADIIAYVLMPNHYHLLVKVVTDELSHAMQLFGISYTKAMNRRFQRTGALFQGAFRAKLVEKDEYLLHLSRYIHLNPVRAGLVKRAEDWVYSSYRDYLHLRKGTLPRPGIVLGQFADAGGYRAFVEAYREKDREVIGHLLFE
jgi:REP element-mobilizing transposase RayT